MHLKIQLEYVNKETRVCMATKEQCTFFWQLINQQHSVSPVSISSVSY